MGRKSGQQECCGITKIPVDFFLRFLHSLLAMSKQVIVRNSLFEIETIYCKGDRRGHIGANIDEARMREIAKWVLENAVSRISGVAEQHLREWLAGCDRGAPLAIAREFNHLVP